MRVKHGVPFQVLAPMLAPLLLSVPTMHRRGESFPHLAIACVFLQHALGMKLQAHQKIGVGIVIGLDQAVIGVRHRPEAVREFANALVMIAIHAQRFPAIPARERRARDDGNGMAVRIVIVIIDVRAVRAFFFLHVAVQRASANHVQELRAAADAQYRDFPAQRVAQQANFDFVFERMRLFKILKVALAGLEALRFDVFAFHQQQAVHAFHVLREASGRAGDDGHNHRQGAQLDQKFEMKFADVIDEFIFPRGPARDDENNRAIHCISVRSASTRRASFSRPCEATRM